MVLTGTRSWGRRPFLGDTSQEVLTQHKQAAPPDPRSLRPALSDGLAETILRCLAKDPAQRYATAGALRRALQQLGSTRVQKNAM